MTIPVVAAVIFHAGRVLICQRRAGDSLALKWEFPGGKVQKGESLRDALVRELKEELDVEADVGEFLHETSFTYGQLGSSVRLSFFRAAIPDPARIRSLAFETTMWEQPGNLGQYDFLPADLEIVARLASGAISPAFR